MTTDKPALSAPLNQFLARVLVPINAYPGTALIARAAAPLYRSPPLETVFPFKNAPNW
ncbi:MAG: hypothetical protein ACPG4I_08145 [Candidatus Puniceispirillaceae bacterium]